MPTSFAGGRAVWHDTTYAAAALSSAATLCEAHLCNIYWGQRETGAAVKGMCLGGWGAIDAANVFCGMMDCHVWQAGVQSK